MCFVNIETANSGTNQAICAGGKCGIEFSFIGAKLIHWLDFIEVEWEFSRNTAIQTCFQVSCPILCQYIFSSDILFAHPSNSRVHRFPTIYILNSCFTEEKVNVFSNVKGTDKIGFCKKKKKRNCFYEIFVWYLNSIYDLFSMIIFFLWFYFYSGLLWDWGEILLVATKVIKTIFLLLSLQNNWKNSLIIN